MTLALLISLNLQRRDLHGNLEKMVLRRPFGVFIFIGIVTLASSVQCAAVSEITKATDQNTNTNTVHVLVPTIHASIVEAPFKTDAVHENGNGVGFLAKIRRQFGILFGQTSHNHGSKSEEEKNNKNDTLFVEEAKTNVSTAMKETSPEGPPTHDNQPLKTSSTDIVTAKMRLVSFLESISASLEDMRMFLKRTFRVSKRNSYEIASVNETTLVAAVPGKRFFVEEGAHEVRPVWAVFNRHKLTVVIAEFSFIEHHKDNSSKISEKAARFDTEYQFTIKNAHPVVGGIYLLPADGTIPGYQIIVPLIKESGSDEKPVSRAIADAMRPDADVDEKHWETSREEDEYEFLHAQMACQKAHGTSGIRRMLCTCERVHQGNLTRRLLCIARIADKVIRVAKDHGEVRIAAKIYRGTVDCRNAKHGVKESHDCLVRVLDEHAGSSSALDTKHGRNILETKSEGNNDDGAIDKLLTEETIRASDLRNNNGTGQRTRMEKWSTRKVAIRGVTALVYFVGGTFLLACLLDLAKQYRRHHSEHVPDASISRLPAHAQALYARLTLRS